MGQELRAYIWFGKEAEIATSTSLFLSSVATLSALAESEGICREGRGSEVLIVGGGEGGEHQVQ